MARNNAGETPAEKPTPEKGRATPGLLDRDDSRRPLRGGDLKLLARLWPFARPLRGFIMTSVVLILGSALISLALPYVTKLAIDRYIVPVGQKLTVPQDGRPLPPEARELLGSGYYHDSGESGVYYLTPDSEKILDKKKARRLIESGFLSQGRYLAVPLPEKPDDPDRLAALDLARRFPEQAQIHPKCLAIAETDLTKFPEGALLAMRHNDLSGLGRLAVFFAGLMFLGYVLEFGQRVIMEISAQKLSHRLRQSLLGHLFTLGQSFFDREQAGRLTSRVTNDVDNLNNLTKTTVSTLFSDLIALVGITVIMFYMSPTLALVTLALAPVTAFLISYFGGLSRARQRELRARLAIINQNFAETMGGLPIIQAFNHEEHSVQLFDRLNQDNYRVGLSQIKVHAVFMPLIDFFASCILAMVIWFGGGLVVSDALSLGVVAAFVGYARRFFQPIQDMAEKLNLFQSALASLERLTELLDRDERLPEPAVPLKPKKPGGGVVFENVDFRYLPDGPLVLKDISFKIAPGESVALVGETGSGKSSIINLMLRFYDPVAGRILFDGQPLDQLDLAAHRARLGLVTQDVYLYSGTVMENLRLGRASLSDGAIEAAARAVGADGFIRRLPLGYNQPLGAGGRRLSAGERQLLACARALTETPEIIILDEATASVDSESEMLIERALHTLFQGRTSIIIAHRLSTIRRVDRILVLHRGRLAEEGGRQELMEKKGVFHRLATRGEAAG